ncbi:MAG: cupin domain-containing protein [Proteobacteria bacterium]|nr:cupin domain-containing protein [Pseudomonadota bacterium]
MKRTSLILSIALAATILVGAGGGLDLGAQERKAYISKSKSTPLIKTAVAGVAGKEVNIVRFALPSGFVGGRHSHPGQVFVYILEGSLGMEIEGAAPRKLEAGDVFQ